MALQASVGFQIPTNVVEVGNEISADQLAAIGASSFPSAANPMATQSFVTGQGYINGIPAIAHNQLPLYVIQTGSATIDEGDHYYIFVIGISETLTIDDEVNNNPPIGTQLTVVSTSMNGFISCSGSVTCNGSTGFVLPSNTVLKLVKIAANTWWIG